MSFIEHGLTFITIKNAFKKQGCPICNINHEEEERYLKFLLYENVNDGSIRNKIINSMGFCEKHFYMMERIEDDEFKDHLGSSIIIESLMNTLDKKIAKCIELTENKANVKFKNKKSDKIKQSILDALSPKNECYLCEILNTDETYYINEIITNMYEKELSVLLEKSAGFCYKHLLKAILCYTGDIKSLNEFLKIHIRRIKDIDFLIQEYIRKHNYEYAEEPKGKEQGSYSDALEILLGNKS